MVRVSMLQAEGDASKGKGADKALRKEAGRLTKLQEELERSEARYSPHDHFFCCFSARFVLLQFLLQGTVGGSHVGLSPLRSTA